MASKKPYQRDKGEFEPKAEPSPEPGVVHGDGFEASAPALGAEPIIEPVAETPARSEPQQAPGAESVVQFVAEAPTPSSIVEPTPTIDAATPIVVSPEPAFESADDAPAAAFTQAETVVAVDFSAPTKVASHWQKAAVEMWSENAVAFFDLASRLARATTVSDVIDLQSRFAQERFEGFARLSNDYVEFAQRAARDAGAAAFRFSRSA